MILQVVHDTEITILARHSRSFSLITDPLASYPLVDVSTMILPWIMSCMSLSLGHPRSLSHRWRCCWLLAATHIRRAPRAGAQRIWHETSLPRRWLVLAGDPGPTARLHSNVMFDGLWPIWILYLLHPPIPIVWSVWLFRSGFWCVLVLFLSSHLVCCCLCATSFCLSHGAHVQEQNIRSVRKCATFLHHPNPSRSHRRILGP